MNDVSVIVYPATDVAKAKQFFGALTGVDPYVDSPYYVGYRTEHIEIGLDPRGHRGGPIAYWTVSDINASLKRLVEAGGETVQDVKDVGGGMTVATLKNPDGSLVGLRQPPPE